MTQRFFRATEAVYEQARATLDAAWGHPGPVAITCIEPAATAPRDADGCVLLAVDVEFCNYSTAKDLLPQLLANGLVEEVTEGDYSQAFRA
jgi:hypothetical protein